MRDRAKFSDANKLDQISDSREGVLQEMHQQYSLRMMSLTEANSAPPQRAVIKLTIVTLSGDWRGGTN